MGSGCTSVAVASIEADSGLKGYLHDSCLVFSVALGRITSFVIRNCFEWL